MIVVRTIRKVMEFVVTVFVRKQVRCTNIFKNRFFGFPLIDAKGEVVIGEKNVFCSSSLRTALGVSKRVSLKTLNSSSTIIIGNDNGFSGTTICASKKIQIGSGCLFGADVTIVDTDFHPINSRSRRYQNTCINSAPVHIMDNVFIGLGSIILKGVTIGENSVIGAGSVVSKSIPPNVIAAGNPCSVIKVLDLGAPS